MRGKVSSHIPFCVRGGITPAYAGKSALISAAALTVWDHLRVCGEKALNWAGISEDQGSPPRMRGKGNGNAGEGGTKGITPAYAGKRL